MRSSFSLAPLLALLVLNARAQHSLSISVSVHSTPALPTSPASAHSTPGTHSASSSGSVSISIPASASQSTASASANVSSTASTPGNATSTSASTSGAFTPFPVPSDVPIPPLYPAVDPSSPPNVGAGIVPDFGPAWKEAYGKAKIKLANLTLEEKVNISTGVGWMNGRCVGNIPPIEPIDGRGWPGLCLEDSPLGVRFGDFATAFPTGINAAASFNRDLIRQRGLFMGNEHRGKGVNIALGPMMNLGRLAQGGRNWEGFGADPFLAGEAAYETVLGLQEGGVMGCAKHLVGNEQEHFRTTSSSGIDDRTMHELYAHPFMKSIMAGVGSIMCSYNLINDTFACENDKVMNDIIKREYAFQGFIMSDWSATHSTHSVLQGLDMTMPGDITFDSGTTYFGGNLTAAVNDGTVPLARVNDMATRILAAWYYMHQDSPDYPPTNFNAFQPDDDATNERIDVQDDHFKLVRELGSASAVLLKNTNHALPLGAKDRSIVMVGSGAGPGPSGPNEFSDQGGSDGVLAMGWGSGTANFTYIVTPMDAIQSRARAFRTSISWLLNDFDLPKAGNMARKRSAAIVFIQADSGEDYITVDGNEGDRKNLTAWHGGDNLVLAVAAQNNNTIVVVNSVGPLIVEPWIEHPNVSAVIWAGLSGAEIGNSIADVLYGDWNPSGRLPYTIAKNLADYPAQLTLGGTFNSQGVLEIPYTEGLFIDYRHFDANGIQPRFEFGFGLSYTSFKYSNLVVSKISGGHIPAADQALITAWESGKATAIAEGSTTAFWLHVPAYQATFNVQNSGTVFGGEIPQLYINFPASSGEPPSVLRGFTDTAMAPGATNKVTITLSRYDLSIWDVELQGWRRPAGSIGVTVGASSRDARLKGSVPV